MNLTALGDFLQHYQHDVACRWTAEERHGQEQFVCSHVSGERWLDWSGEQIALQILQEAHATTSTKASEEAGTVLLAGPLVEIVEPLSLLQRAVAHLKPGGCIVGIFPCLRDNSPESQLFMDQARADLWPYYTAEELLELLRDTECGALAESSRFHAIPTFNRAVLNDELRFKGFRRIFDPLERDGYDPMEIGWGELRFVASVP